MKFSPIVIEEDVGVFEGRGLAFSPHQKYELVVYAAEDERDPLLRGVLRLYNVPSWGVGVENSQVIEVLTVFPSSEQVEFIFVFNEAKADPVGGFLPFFIFWPFLNLFGDEIDWKKILNNW